MSRLRDRSEKTGDDRTVCAVRLIQAENEAFGLTRSQQVSV